MRRSRRITAVLAGVQAIRDELGCGVALAYTPTSRNARDLERVEDFADLGPEPSIETTAGLGVLVRVLRAARIKAPRPPEAWLGEPEQAADLLGRAVGQSFALEGIDRLRLCFRAWTDDEPIVVDAVSDVVDDGTAFLVHRLGHRPLVRIPREEVVRHALTREPWFEIHSIERS